MTNSSDEKNIIPIEDHRNKRNLLSTLGLSLSPDGRGYVNTARAACSYVARKPKWFIATAVAAGILGYIMSGQDNSLEAQTGYELSKCIDVPPGLDRIVNNNIAEIYFTDTNSYNSQ